MRARTVAALLAAATTASCAAPAQASRLLVMDRGGQVHAVDDPHLPRAVNEPAAPGRGASASPARARARVAAAARAAPRALRQLLATGQIDQATYDRAMGDYERAVQLRRKLTGARRAAIAGVLGDLESMAARGYVVPSRLPELTATLEANNRWWAGGPLLGAGARTSFAGSSIVWQHYPGHGLQVQWLATFGKANALWKDKDEEGFRDILGESLSLAVPRAGGIAFEYLFAFDGGAPPWVSGLSQGTALSALSRGWLMLKDRTWLDAARNALGIFRTPPPAGIAQTTAAGTHYLQYSFAPRLHVLNGFVQSLNGLFDYATTANDAEAQALFDAGSAEAAAELPAFDTGGWSRYSNYTESSLSYHKLLRDFLLGLCKRLQRHGEDGQPYCEYGYRFATDVTRAPELSFASPRQSLRAKRTARIVFRIDKPARVTLAITRGSYVHRITVSVGSGRHSLAWKPPSAGSYSYRLDAVDLAGNAGSATAGASVRR